MQDRVKQRIGREIQQQRHGKDQDKCVYCRTAKPIPIPFAETDGEHRARAYGKAEKHRRQKRHERIRRADRRQCVFAERLSYDQRIRDIIKLLQQISRSHGQREQQQRFCDTSFRQIPVHTSTSTRQSVSIDCIAAHEKMQSRFMARGFPFCRLPQRSVPESRVALQMRYPCARAARCHRSVRLFCQNDTPPCAEARSRGLEPLPSSRASAGSHDGCPRRISLSSRDLCFIIEVIAKPFHCASAAMRFHR